MQTVIMGSEALAAGSVDWVVAGGMESMTNAPTCSRSTARARASARHRYDHMFLDGLEDAYEAGKAMGSFAQCTADEYQLTRATWTSIRSNRSPRQQRDRQRRLRRRDCRGDRLGPQGRCRGRYRRSARQGPPGEDSRTAPAFAKEGTITAATSSSISDGAAAVVLTRESLAKPRAKRRWRG
jgi:acetyl-CoA C-acetyltransferase